MNKYLALKGQDKFDTNKITVVGSPTITSDGILSNCSRDNAVNTKVQLLQLKGKSWAIKGSVVLGSTAHTLVKLSSVGNGYYTALGCVSWIVSTKRIYFSGRTGIVGDTNNEGFHITSSSIFEIGDKIYYTLSFDVITGTYSLYVDKVDGTTYQGKWTPSTDNKELYYINTQPSYYISLGTGSDNSLYLTTGSIDIKDFSVEIDGQLVFQPVKPTYLLERRKEGYDPSKFTIVGSPTITEYGVASGFSDNNYLKLSSPVSIGGNEWELCARVYAVENTKTDRFQTIFADYTTGTQFSVGINRYGTGLAIVARKSNDSIITVGASDNKFNANTWHNVLLKYSNKTIYAYVDGILQHNISIDLDDKVYNGNQVVGLNPLNQQMQYGFIDLTQFSITVDGKEVFTGAKENYYMLRR